MRRFVTILVVPFLLASSVAFSQTNDHAWRSFDWFEDVGAPRAAGVGGAFVGLADDSSAILFNPAGLGTLTKMEVLGSAPDRTTGTLLHGDTTSSRVGLGLISMAGPIKGTRLAVGAYVAQPFDEQITIAAASVAGIRDSGSLNSRITDYGAALAWTPVHDLYVGLRVNASHLDLGGTLVHPIEGNRDTLIVPFSASGTRAAGNLGLLLKVTPSLMVGTSYTQGARWDALRSSVSVRFGPLPPVPFQFSSPNRLSGGASYQLSPRVTFTGEADYVFLSRLHDTFQIVALSTSPANYRLDNGVAVRGGMEVTVPKKNYSFQFRGGVDSEPAGSFQYVAPVPAFESQDFSGVGRQTEGTIGAGILDKRARYRFDMAFAFGALRNKLIAGIGAHF